MSHKSPAFPITITTGTEPDVRNTYPAIFQK